MYWIQIVTQNYTFTWVLVTGLVTTETFYLEYKNIWKVGDGPGTKPLNLKCSNFCLNTFPAHELKLFPAHY